MQQFNQGSIRKLLLTNDKAVERAIVALYRRQLADEQAGGTTKHANGRGFNMTHAHTGSYCAKWILQGKRLTGHWLVDCRDIAMFYSRQLLEIAKERAQVKASHRTAA